MAYEPSDQAKQEIEEILSEPPLNKMHPKALISLVDVRRLMILCWDRGYTACLESLKENKSEQV
jgi:hypothetical protein